MGLTQFKAPPAPERETFDFPQGYAGGMDISQSPDLISKNKSPDMQNMNYDAGGVPTKRTGFKKVNTNAYGTEDVRGLFEYEKSDGSLVLLMAWNGKLWSVASDGTKTDLCTGTKASIADTQVDGWTFDGKFYFLTGTEYCYWDGTNPVAVVTGYVPTVLISCAPTGGGTVDEAYNFISNSFKQSYSSTGSATVFQMAHTALTSVDSVKVSGALIDPADYTVDLVNGTVTFDSGVADGTNNVVIQATKAGLKDSTIISGCNFHVIYGGQNDTRLFFSGNPTYKNFRFQSGLMDCTYFPDDGDQEIPDTDAEAVTGMARMGNYLITLTESKRFWTDVTADGSTVAFTINPLNDQYGCSSWRTAILAQDGLLSLSYQGVTWTNASTVRTQLNTRCISDSINRSAMGILDGLLESTRADMESAHAYIYRNKYILHVGSKCWVLDLDYSVLSQGIYCWYPYSGLYSTLTEALEREDGLLWVGDNGGRIYKSCDDYDDGGAAIDAWWTSPIITSDRSWIKKFERLNITFGGQAKADHVLTVITDDGVEDTAISSQDTRAFNYLGLNYGGWTYGCTFYPSTQSEKIGYKGEYVQWKVRNNTIAQRLVLLAQTLIFRAAKRVK